MGLEDVFSELAVIAAGENRIPDRVEVNRATDEQFMCKVYFVGETDFETFHILPEEA